MISTPEERREKKRAYDHARVLARQARLARATTSTRFCRTCQTDKPIADFYPSCETRCKACDQAKAMVRRDERLEYLRAWRKANPNRAKQWADDNRTHRTEYMRKWREDHKQHRAQRYSEWARANKSRVTALIAKRIAAKLSATPQWVDHAAIRAVYAEAERLTKTTGIKHHVDHILPLRSPLVCGLHVPCNLRVITATANRSKGNRLPQHHQPASASLRQSDSANFSAVVSPSSAAASASEA